MRTDCHCPVNDDRDDVLGAVWSVTVTTSLLITSSTGMKHEHRVQRVDFTCVHLEIVIDETSVRKVRYFASVAVFEVRYKDALVDLFLFPAPSSINSINHHFNLISSPYTSNQPSINPQSS